MPLRRILPASLILLAFVALAAIPRAPRERAPEPRGGVSSSPSAPPPLASAAHAIPAPPSALRVQPDALPNALSAEPLAQVSRETLAKIETALETDAVEPTLDFELHDLRLEGPRGVAVLLDGASDASVTLQGLAVDGKAFPFVARRIEAGRYDTLHAVLSLRSTGLDGAIVPVYCAGDDDELARAQACTFEWSLADEGEPLRVEDGALPLWLRIDVPRRVGPDGQSLVVEPRIAVSTQAPR